MSYSSDRRYSFSGGLNTQANVTSLRNDELSDARNISYDVTGALSSRGGQARITTAPASSATVTSLFRYYQRSGTKFTLFFRNQTMYKVSGTDGTSIDSTSFTANTSFTGATFNDIFYYTNGVDTTSSRTMRKWTGSGTASAPTGSPTNPCRYLIASTKMQRLLAAGDDTSPDAFYGSALGDGEDWTSSNNAFTIFIRTFKGDRIVGLREVKAGILVFKTSSVHLVTGTDPQTIQVIPLALDIGCTAPKSIAGNRDRAFWLYNHTVYESDGSKIYSISERITPTIQEMTSLGNAVGIVYSATTQRYRLHVTPQGGTTNTECLEYYFSQPSKSGSRPWTRHNSMSVASAVILDGDSGELYTGDYAGYVNQQDTGTTDFGTDIDAYGQTGWQFLGEPDRRKRFRRLWVVAEPTGAYDLNIYDSYDGMPNASVPLTLDLTPNGTLWGSFTWGDSNWGGASTFIDENVLLSSVTAQSIQLRFQCSDPFKVYGYSIINRKKPIR